jgi:hypothetical protein
LPDFTISKLLVFSRSGEWRQGHLDNGNRVDGDKAMKTIGREPRLDTPGVIIFSGLMRFYAWLYLYNCSYLFVFLLILSLFARIVAY